MEIQVQIDYTFYRKKSVKSLVEHCSKVLTYFKLKRNKLSTTAFKDSSFKNTLQVLMNELKHLWQIYAICSAY